MLRVRFREEEKLFGDTVELDADIEENGVSGLEEGLERISRPSPCGWDGRTTNSVTDVAGDDGVEVDRGGETITGGESERARAS